MGKQTNLELVRVLLPFGRGGGVNHDTAEWWQFMGRTLHLALCSVPLTVQASPRSCFMPSLGSPYIEQGREGKGKAQGDWKLVQGSQTGHLLFSLLTVVSLPHKSAATWKIHMALGSTHHTTKS